MKNIFTVPADLQAHVKTVGDNRQPNEEIIIDAEFFVLSFRNDFEQWLESRRSKTAPAAQTAGTTTL